MLKILKTVTESIGSDESNLGQERARKAISDRASALTRALSSERAWGVPVLGRRARAIGLAMLVVLAGVALAFSVGVVGGDDRDGPPEGMVGVPGDQVGPPDDAGPPDHALETIPTHAAAWQIHASDHAGDLEVEIGANEDGELQLELTDEINSDGREVAIDAGTLQEVVGERPERAFGEHSSGESWASTIEYQGGYAVFEIPKFSSNTVEFSGERSLVGQPVSDGDQLQHKLGDDESIDDLDLSLTGVANQKWRNSSGQNEIGESTPIDIGGSKAPGGPLNGNPKIEVTGHGGTSYYPDDSMRGSFVLFGEGYKSEYKIEDAPGYIDQVDVEVREIESGQEGSVDIYIKDGKPTGDYTEGELVYEGYNVPDIDDDGFIWHTIDLQEGYLAGSDEVTISFVNHDDWGSAEYQIPESYEERDHTVAIEDDGLGDESNYLFDLRASGPTPEDVEIQTDDGESVYIGSLASGETVTEEIDLSKGEPELSFKGSSGGISWDLYAKATTESIDPEVEINGETVGYDGALAQDQSVDLSDDVSKDWFAKENLINISVSEGYETPVGLVDFELSHDAEMDKTVNIESEGWSERYNVSRTWPVDSDDAELRIPWASDRVIEVRKTSVEVNGQSYDADLETDDGELIVDLGDVDEGTETIVEATGSKIQVPTGEIEVLEPTVEGNELETTVKIINGSGEDTIEIDVSGTDYGERLHFLSSSDWHANDRTRWGADESQILELPDGVEGGTFTVETAPLGFELSSGEILVELDDPEDPRFTIEPGESPGDMVDVVYYDTVSGETYELIDLDNDRVVDRSTASSPVSFETTDDPTTYTIEIGEASASISGPGSDEDGSGFESSMLIAAGALSILFSGWVGRRIGLTRIVVPVTLVVGVGIVELSTSRSILATFYGDSTRFLRDLLDGSAEPLVAVVGGALLLGGMWIVDSRTERDIPLAFQALIGSAVAAWVLVSMPGFVDGAGEPLLGLLGGAAVLIGIVVVDWQTERDLPRPVFGIVGAGAALWIVESTSPGMVREPIMNGLEEVSTVLWILGALAVAYALVSWVRSRGEPDTEVTLDLGGGQ